MNSIQILLNGNATDQISVQDRGLQYGHGVFETIAWRESQLELWSAHMERLLKGCTQLYIPAPDIDQLKTETLSLCNQFERAIIKITITCGESERGYLSPTAPQANRIITCHSVDKSAPYKGLDSIAVTICSTRLAPQPLLAGLKHLNRLEQVLAREEWRENKETDYQEGLMLDYAGSLVSGTMSNVFFIRGGEIYTNDLALSGVQGVMRGFIMSLAKTLKLKLHCGQYKLAQVLHSDEIFMTNSLIKINAVKAIDTTKFDAPGPLTQKLWDHLQQHLNEEITEI